MLRQRIQAREKSRETHKTVYKVNEFQKGPKFMINNIVQLKLLSQDITRLELEISAGDIGPCTYEGMGSATTIPVASVSSTATVSVAATAAKKMSSIMKPITVEHSSPKQERKELIINSGVRRKFQPLLHIYNNTWPASSTYACWYCCHRFDTTPVGIPQMLIEDTFYCYGNFCSYNCALRYLLPEDEDDFAQLQTGTDRFVSDDLSDKVQMLELLCHIETGLPFDDSIKLAPKRLTLQLFGGVKTIEEFRSYFTTHTTYHMFRSPMVPISYQMEECSNPLPAGGNQAGRRSIIDINKLERAYKTLLNERKEGTILQKLLKNRHEGAIKE